MAELAIITVKFKEQPQSSAVKTVENGKTKLDPVERAICKFYDVNSFAELNVGKFEQLVAEESTMNNEGVVYIDSLLTTADQAYWTETPTERDRLVEQLVECPCLEDVAAFIAWPGTSWQLKALLRELNSKQVRTRAGQLFRLDVLETRPGQLLKLESNTSIELLKDAIESGNVAKTCGHLVSLVAVKYRQSTPESLIANEVESSLAAYLIWVENKAHIFYLFLAEVIVRLPEKLAPRLVFRFVLGPAAKVMNDGQVRRRVLESLVEAARSEVAVVDWRVARLVGVGRRCAVEEWSMESYWSAVRERKEVERSVIDTEF